MNSFQSTIIAFSVCLLGLLGTTDVLVAVSVNSATNTTAKVATDVAAKVATDVSANVSTVVNESVTAGVNISVGIGSSNCPKYCDMGSFLNLFISGCLPNVSYSGGTCQTTCIETMSGTCSEKPDYCLIKSSVYMSKIMVELCVKLFTVLEIKDMPLVCISLQTLLGTNLGVQLKDFVNLDLSAFLSA